MNILKLLRQATEARACLPYTGWAKKNCAKSVHIYQSYCKKNLAQFFWPTLYLYYSRNTATSLSLRGRPQRKKSRGRKTDAPQALRMRRRRRRVGWRMRRIIPPQATRESRERSELPSGVRAEPLPKINLDGTFLALHAEHCRWNETVASRREQFGLFAAFSPDIISVNRLGRSS